MVDVSHICTYSSSCIGCEIQNCIHISQHKIDMYQQDLKVCYKMKFNINQFINYLRLLPVNDLQNRENYKVLANHNLPRLWVVVG